MGSRGVSAQVSCFEDGERRVHWREERMTSGSQGVLSPGWCPSGAVGGGRGRSALPLSQQWVGKWVGGDAWGVQEVDPLSEDL